LPLGLSLGLAAVPLGLVAVPPGGLAVPPGVVAVPLCVPLGLAVVAFLSAGVLLGCLVVLSPADGVLELAATGFSGGVA